MKVAEILALIAASSEVARAVADLVAKSTDTLKERDREALSKALDEMQIQSANHFSNARGALLKAAGVSL